MKYAAEQQSFENVHCTSGKFTSVTFCCDVRITKILGLNDKDSLCWFCFATDVLYSFGDLDGGSLPVIAVTRDVTANS